MTAWIVLYDPDAAIPHFRRADRMDPARFQQVYDAMFAHNLRRSRQLAAEGEGLRQVRNLGYGRLISTFLWAVVERYLAPRTTKRHIFVCPVTSFDARGEHVQLLQNPSAEEARRFVAQFMAQLFSRERPGICVLPLAVADADGTHSLTLVVENANNSITVRFINSNASTYSKRVYTDIASHFVPAYARAMHTNDDERSLQQLGTCAVYSVVSTLFYLDAVPMADHMHYTAQQKAQRKLAISRIANAIGHVEGMCGDQSLEEVIIRRVECRAMSRAVDAIWHEYVFLRGIVQHPCARVADAWGLAPRAAGAPGAENVDMLAVVLRLHEEYHRNEENACLDPRAVREMLRQYYWRDYYHRAHYTFGQAGRIYENGGDIDLTCSWLFMVLVHPDDWPK